ncbi:hypothetical protein ACFSTI_19500 [Rhizorhabdus histidinilytica]|jgi:hypothetical protein|uniref:Uncharacterized protein n=1 Tax=Rhizorhabdus histidinilytica TaxID=439228 RepID=A0A1T5BXN3_9SPHN|nr:hypothetical protein [Rhizorhabdus histidinilytica]SKB51955.1 hypothetical protein SAMN06295920_103369 [Rhizorhabdus histidinilytica]
MTDPQRPSTPADVIAAFANYGTLMNSIAKHASDIAHARRQLYLAYVSEGFTEAQALELCKVMLS